ncbi:hypothetical protein [Phytohabitans houttuyneae]|uniref:Uncharacterized protein n=1 Tax=Phytohabitans houttuyneae TaxID=1076126 RepID=A0A6V8KFS6_9ACTN|nr:hypothetical protein [Phytohabitans houttuyneae]GFJ79585.1 hypothetical protein Phou_037650 [Phytohabitans houttuyneae]
MADEGQAGRHRRPYSLPDWLPDWPGARAWLRQWWITVVSGGLILLTAAAVLMVIAGRDGGRPADVAFAAAAPSDVPATPTVDEPAPVVTTVAPPTPSASPTPRRRPVNPIDRLAAVAVTAQQLVESGDLDRRAGREILRTLATISVAVRDGRTDRAAERLRELENRLGELREDGKLSRAGFVALDVLQPIISSLR